VADSATPAEPARDEWMRAEQVDGSRTRALRRSVLRPDADADQPLPGDDRDDLIHFASFDDDGWVASTCFIYPEACPWDGTGARGWHLRQMATAPAHRGEGYGAAVLDAVVQHVADEGGGILWCNARETAVRFYRQGGLIGEGEIFTDEVHTIPHLRMWRPVEPA
jgi:GNAT superfamily N-acetyltransferase